MLVDKDRLNLGLPVAGWFDRMLAEPGFVPHGQDLAIGIDAGSLPGDIHGDPADRIMVAIARAPACPLLTADRKLLFYAGEGHLRAVDTRL